MVNGAREHVEMLRDEVQRVLTPLGLRLSPAKTRVVHMQDGFDFLGFHIKWMRKRGTEKWYVYTFIADKPVRELKRKIRSLTHRKNQLPFASLLERPPSCRWFEPVA
jgi:RNA-directed DNA polymerase